MNAKREFIKHVGDRVVKCAALFYEKPFNEFTPYILPVDYTDDQFKAYLQSLLFEYDNDFGMQELHGTIWYTDGSWSERGEYDGSEWWEYKACPEMPEEMKG